MLPSWFSVVMLLVTLPLTSGAALAAWKGTFRPHLVTWTLWAAAPIIAATASYTAGAGLSAVSTLASGLGPLLVVVATLAGPHRDVRWPVTRTDLCCSALSVSALVGWWLTGSGLVAVIFAVAADALAAVPTVAKAWRHPASESVLGYIAGLISGVTGLATLDLWAPANWLFPAYIAVLCAAMIVLVKRPQRPARADV